MIRVGFMEEVSQCKICRADKKWTFPLCPLPFLLLSAHHGRNPGQLPTQPRDSDDHQTAVILGLASESRVQETSCSGWRGRAGVSPETPVTSTQTVAAQVMAMTEDSRDRTAVSSGERSRGRASRLGGKGAGPCGLRVKVSLIILLGGRVCPLQAWWPR